MSRRKPTSPAGGVLSTFVEFEAAGHPTVASTPEHQDTKINPKDELTYMGIPPGTFQITFRGGSWFNYRSYGAARTPRAPFRGEHEEAVSIFGVRCGGN